MFADVKRLKAPRHSEMLFTCPTLPCAISSPGWKPAGWCASEPVSAVLEMTEIQTRLLAERGRRCCSRSGRPRRQALRDAGAGQPVRHGRAGRLGHGPRAATSCARSARRWPSCAARAAAAAGAKRMEMLPLVKTVLAMRPKTSAYAPCQEVVLTATEIDLARLPIQGCWPGEPAPLITWPLVVTKGPAASARRTTSISASTACRCWARTRP